MISKRGNVERTFLAFLRFLKPGPIHNDQWHFVALSG